jgi:predicted secreted protein
VYTYTFTAQGTGTATLNFSYLRSWEKNKTPYKTFTVTVEVQ